MKYSLRPLFFLTILTLTGCLDENNEGSLDKQHTYTTERDVYVDAVATLYNCIGSDKDSEGLQGAYRGVYNYNMLTTGEAVMPVHGGDQYDGSFWADLCTHNWTEDSKSLYDTWKYLYEIIVFSNDALTTIDKRRQLLTDEQYRAYRAEVRAIRVLYYYYPMDMFGNISLVATAGESAENVEQASRPEIYRSTTKELQEVTPLLPTGHNNLLGKNYERVTCSVANFLLTKLMLNGEVCSNADWTDNQQPNGKQTYSTINGQQMNTWQACKYYCDKVITDGFALTDDYLSSFSVNNENSPEDTFTIPLDKHLYKSQFRYLFRSRHYSYGGVFGIGSESGACTTISMVKTFGYGTKNVDKRYAYNLYSDTVRVDGNIIYLENGKPLVYIPPVIELNLINSLYIKTTEARMAKYKVDRNTFNDGKSPDNSIILFHYADVLLMKTEAAVRNEENDNIELDFIRSRSGVGNRTTTLDNILAERLMELMWEGWRRSDLIRFNRFHRSYDLRTAPETETDCHTIVFPIPSRALDLNEKLRQDKSYKR